MARITRERGITTPQIQIQGVDSSQASVTEQVSTFALKTADILADKANKKYELDFKNMAAEGINDIYRRNQTNPLQLGKEAKGLKSSLKKNAPWSMQDQFDATFDDALRPYMNKATDGYDAVLTDQLKESTLKRLEQNKQAAGKYTSELFGKNPERRLDAQTALQNIILDSANISSQHTIDGKPVLGASERVSAMQSLVNDTAYFSVVEGFDNAVDKRAFMRQHNTGELKHSVYLNDKGDFAEMSTRDGMDAKNQERIQNYMENGIKSIDAEAKKQAETQANVNLVDSIFRDEGILDPTDAKAKKAVDDHFKTFMPSLQGMSTADKTNAISDYVSKTGIYPTSLESSVNAQLSNGTAGQKVIGAEIVNIIAEKNPQTVLQINDTIRARARAISDNIAAGLDPETAVLYAENSVFQKDTPEYKARRERFSDAKNGEQVKFREGDYTEHFRDDPSEIPDAMRADYDTLNRSYYMDGGVNAKQASDLAKEKIKAQWGVTTVDDNPRWMKHAPELIYKNDAGTEWIARQLRDDIGRIPSIQGEGYDPDLFLSVAPSTARRPDPSYLVFERDGNGILKPFLTNTGKQAVFKPDYKQSEEYRLLLQEFSGDQEAAMLAARNRRNRSLAEIDKSTARKERKLQRAKALKDLLRVE